MRAKFATFKENLWQIQSDVQDTVDELEFGGEAGRISDRRSAQQRHVPLHLNGLDDNFKAELEWYKGEVSRLQNAEAQIQAMAVNYASLLKEREEELQKLHDDFENLKKLNAGTSGQSPLLNPDDRRSTEVGVMLVNGQESVKGGKNILSYKQPKQGFVRMQGSQFPQSAKHANAGIEILSESEGNELHTEKYKKLQEREKELLHSLEDKSKALSAVKVDNEKLLTELKMLKTSRIKEQSDTASLNLQHHKVVANQKELTSLKVEKQEMAKQIADLQRLLNEKNVEVNKLKEMVGKATISNEHIERLKNSRERLEKEKTELQTEKDGLLDKLNILQQESQRGNALKGLHEMPDKGPEKAHQINLSNENGGSLRESHKLKIAELEQSLKNASKERDKALRDLSRLKQHILDKEKEDTEKMDQDSERIAALQTELDDKTKHILEIERSLAYAIAGQEEAKRVSADELKRANEMISELQEKLAGCLSALEAKNVELQNLQTVLGQYYAEIEAKERVYSELAAAKDEILKLYEHLKQVNCALELKNKEKDELSEKLAISERMLVEKQQRSEGLENEIARLRFALEQSMTQLSRMSSDSDYLVDRRIVIKLLVTYFQRQNSKEVLDLMVRMLGFSDEEKQRIGIAQQVSGKGVVRGVLGLPGRLVGGMLGSGASENSPLPPAENQSFSDLWIDFLLKESEERERRENAEAHSKGTVRQDESANISGATTNARGDSSIKPFLQKKGPFSTSHYSTSSSVYSITDQARKVETLNKGQRASYSDSEFSTVPLNSLTPSSGMQQSRMPKS